MKPPDQIRAELNDHSALVATLAGEAAGEPLAGQVAVACVIRNRATLGGWWGRTIAAVCLCRNQFSCWWERGQNTLNVYCLAEALLTGQADIGTSAYRPELVAQLSTIATAVISGQQEDITNGATHYLTNALYTSPKSPPWSRGVKPCAVIGNHAFFKGIR